MKSSEAHNRADALAKLLNKRRPILIQIMAVIPFFLIPATVVAPVILLTVPFIWAAHHLAASLPGPLPYMAAALAALFSYHAMKAWEDTCKNYLNAYMKRKAIAAALDTLAQAAKAGMNPDRIADLATGIGKALAQALGKDVETRIVDADSPEGQALSKAMGAEPPTPKETGGSNVWTS